MATPTPIALIGLGNMGKELGKNLLSSSNITSSLIVYDKNPEAVKALVKEGAIAAGSIADVGKKAKVIVSMLPNDAILSS